MTVFKEDVLNKVIDLGKLNYPAKKCISVLGLEGDSAIDFETQFFDTQSEVAKKYQIGIDLADFELDSKIFQLAKSGDLKAIKEYDERRKIYAASKKQEEIKRNKK